MNAKSLLIRKQLLSAIALDPLIVAVDTGVITAIASMEKTGSSCVLVVRNNHESEAISLVGIVTKHDIFQSIAQHVLLDNLSIQSVMHDSVVTIQESALIDFPSVLKIYQQYRIHHLPVLDGDRLVGVLSQDALIDLLTQNVLQGGFEDQDLSILDHIEDSRDISEKIDSTITAGVTSLHDLTTLKQVKESLQNREQFLRTIYEGVEQAIFTVDVLEDGDFRLVAFNPAAERLTGRSTAEISGKSPTKEVLQNYIACVQAGTSITYEECLVFKGQPTWWITTLNPIYDALGRICRIVGTSTNISQRKKMETALQNLIESTSAVTGEDFFPALVSHIAKALNVSYAVVTEVEGDRLHTLAIWTTDTLQTDFLYDFAKSPCQRTLQDGMFFCDRFLQQQFPEDRDLVGMGVDSYLGIALRDSHNRAIGTLCILDKQPIQDPLWAESLLRIFASRAAAELERERAMNALENLNQELETRVKERTAALQESQRFIQQIADASPNILYLYDLQEQRNIYVNREIGIILGYTPDEIQSMGSNLFTNLIHPDDLKKLASYHTQIYAAQDDEILEFEYRIRHVNGEWRWFYGRDAVFKRDADGHVMQTIGTAQDITERKRLEQEQSNLLSILEASTDYILIADVTGQVIWNNNALKRMRGLYSDAEVKQQRPIDYHPQWTVDILEQKAVPTVLVEGSWLGETALLDADGQEILVSQLLLGHKSSEGEVEFFSTIMRDIRVQKDYEQQLEQTNAEMLRATRLKDEFLANMSHELRTPLNAILGMSEALQEEVFGKLNERQAASISTVESSGRHLLGLINDILELSKIEAGKLELDIDQVSITDLCKSSLVFVKQQAFKKQIQLNESFPKDMKAISVDERRMRQVLINLLTNAVKFTPTGGKVMIEVHYEPIDFNLAQRIPIIRPTQLPDSHPAMHDWIPHDDCYVCISVIDTGIGIKPEDQEKLFQPFVQIDSSLNRQYEGTGLGLALVKRIVEMHGGDVSIHSELGTGSCFTLRLPHISQLDQKSLLTASPFDKRFPKTEVLTAPAEPHYVNPYLILLAEDNETNIITMTSYLSAKGYQILCAKNGQEAIAMAVSSQPDLILMDVQMPVMDGLEAMRQMRQIPSLANTPIIALTALAMTGDRDRCIMAGANEYLTKPVKLSLLTQTIQNLLNI
ncbi:PAS domain S-box protein [Pseudanabaena galeata UHCC 0370]|uniref:histidine kinase n=1 Tax=Pseudanabaena galeata UHCC 0370 TaxID=3110310 RepID=A0ABU5THL2_9CYAN|nr:PAS domain S-box protein [Pseudanabaena galeata]MEA5477740.1 PAS domain S-box protein [Pseudanabaena galeata UHCC 0370]